ncbi:esterase/lipase/thioesterase family protein [Aquitalea magnusonii]|uniref:Esterase/lipase/thioesterase family protein n=1 Tax=Aquitalea magnusonii TaxID=332411 RepID=A0A3G9GPD2_9NEIS|nr:alpha/beta fold hydrolase [Aquitalea magnusonii]BBF87631.1 esterase/lipase/thioesterase family protein [Aquitalea magnusonii]
MTHGTFSDKRICLGLAHYLAKRGATCWLMEWRGHGSSPPAVEQFDFETIALYDVPAVLHYLQQREKVVSLHAVTHSGGGLALLMCLLRQPQWQPLFGKLVLFACQACHAAPSPSRRLLLRSARLLSSCLGRVPGKRLGIGVQDEPFYLMSQWFDWNLAGRFVGQDGFDYLPALAHLPHPVLAVCADHDPFIAPPAACRRFFQALSGPQHRYLLAGQGGIAQGYRHGSIMLSRRAALEIWPRVANWLDLD